MIDIEQPMIRIRLYREGADTWNQPIIKKEKKKKRRHMYNS
jgi:hypothetical protein